MLSISQEMKVSSSLAFLLIQISVCNSEIVSEAIVSILERNLNDSWPIKTDLVFFGNDITLTDKILQRLTEKFPVKVINGSSNKVFGENTERHQEQWIKYSQDAQDTQFEPWNNQLWASSVLIFESAQNFTKFAANLTWVCNRNFRYKHILLHRSQQYATNSIQSTHFGSDRQSNFFPCLRLQVFRDSDDASLPNAVVFESTEWKAVHAASEDVDDV